MLYFVGLDLGQASDYCALCVIEEAVVVRTRGRFRRLGRVRPARA